MKMKMILVLVVFALLFCSLPNVWFGDVVVSGSAVFGVHNVDTSLNYTTIQGALDASETLGGHTIRVDSGMYYENVVVNKPVSLLGENVDTTVIDAGKTGNGILVRSSNAGISGFTVQNGGGVAFQNVGILLENVRNCTVSDNKVKDNNYGIWVENSGGNTLQRNTMVHNVYNFVASGTYLSHFVNSVDSSNTVDGRPVYYWVNRHDEQIPFDAGYVAAVNCTGITVCNLSLSNNGQGLLFAFVNGSTVENVSVMNNLDGIWIADSGNCTVTRNNAIHNGRYGVELERSVDCRIVGNEASGNGYEFKYSGYGIFVGDCRNVLIAENRGHENYYAIVVFFCRNCVISSNTVSNNSGMGIWPKLSEECIYVGNEACDNTFYGLEPEDCTNCIISGNNASGNGAFGIWLLGSSNLTVAGNYLQKNGIGIGVTESNFNEMYRNSLVCNRRQAAVEDSRGNDWNMSVEGNYWSDYVGQDVNQDGIGDTVHVIDEMNKDHFPLLGMFSDFGTSLGQHVGVVSNSTIVDFEYFESNSTIKIHVSNSSDTQTYGFCRVSVSKSLISPPYRVFVDDGLKETLDFDGAVYDNGTHRWIYFAYELPAYEVSIIPEFSSVLCVAALLAATLTVVIVCKRRRLTQAMLA